MKPIHHFQILFSLFLCAVPQLAMAAERPEALPWAQTQAILNRASSVWTSPPRDVVRGGMTRGPLLGNGGVGVTATSDRKPLSLRITTWTPVGLTELKT